VVTSSLAVLIQSCDLVTDMLLAVLSVCSQEELEETSSDEDDTRTIADLALTPNEIAHRRQQIKNKILAVGRMQRVFQILRCVTLVFLSGCN
jgi:serine/threonine-protein phosphatase 2B catalytic subunit